MPHQVEVAILADHDVVFQPDAEALSPLEELRRSLRALLDDQSVPRAVREALRPEYEQLQTQLDKLEQNHVHIGVFGRVSVGKSSLLNALLGAERFEVSPLHGATRRAEMSDAVELQDGQVFFIDTPGIDEIDGEDRERQAREVAERCDLLLFVVEADLTSTELDALRAVLQTRRPLLLVLNKSDRYTREEQDSLRARLVEHSRGLVPSENIVLASADPARRAYILLDEQGREREELRQPEPEISQLRSRLWDILDREGKSLAALHAGLFAGRVSDQVAKRIVAIKSDVARQLVQRYCLAKGLGVAVNPIPVADLAAAATLDVALVYHLSRVYGLPLTRTEAGRLVRVIFTQLALLMGAVWGMNVLSSALKTVSAGLSVAVTAIGQGAVAWYATFVVGTAARRYLENGASWGPEGPKRAVKKILDEIDRESVIAEARDELRKQLRMQKKADR